MVRPPPAAPVAVSAVRARALRHSGRRGPGSSAPSSGSGAAAAPDGQRRRDEQDQRHPGGGAAPASGSCERAGQTRVAPREDGCRPGRAPDRDHPAPAPADHPPHTSRPGTDRPAARQADERPPLPRKAAGWGNVARGAPTRSASGRARSAPGTIPTSGSANAAERADPQAREHSGRGTTAPASGRMTTPRPAKGRGAAQRPASAIDEAAEFAVAKAI